jgi:hypothetical protein
LTPEKLTVLQLVKKFSTFYGTLRFITALTPPHHVLFLSQTIEVVPRISVIGDILFFRLCVGLSSGLFPPDVPTATE